MADPRRAPLPAPPGDGAPAMPSEPAGGHSASGLPSDTGPPTAPGTVPAPAPAERDGTDAPARRDGADAPAGRADVRALVRVQLRIALQTAAIVLGVIAAVPALLALTPGLRGLRLLGLPAGWLLPVLGVQPLWVLAALAQLRRAERAERDHPAPPGRS
ncbi:hypothetical protein F8568_012815 [Actinomadura sp. LD22]|uniref:DUF485 domain-containing protein n=1 Tax=Actinomadura physcomitrii TaxID=2650748 RepID=A0A6I4M575_9ACTN|nr:hypothetical protein [Actinomadura physcomitrii]MWA01248.1 hypothetical protein [Actinomadura physcomitrii]